MPTSEALLVGRSTEPRTLTALLLESIALRRQIAVLELSRSRRGLALRPNLLEQADIRRFHATMLMDRGGPK